MVACNCERMRTSSRNADDTIVLPRHFKASRGSAEYFGTRENVSIKEDVVDGLGLAQQRSGEALKMATCCLPFVTAKTLARLAASHSGLVQSRGMKTAMHSAF
mmetsp:Transcript_26908/g.44696  ORF Transcript_26908/g.44696 Transcript_26908/m.44696 type:complete len:103 (-) Transcript_26908:312-620(-)